MVLEVEEGAVFGSSCCMYCWVCWCGGMSGALHRSFLFCREKDGKKVRQRVSMSNELVEEVG